MQWIIEGADADSGDEGSITVEAQSRAHAEAIARGRGMLVTLVYQAESPADALAAMAGPPEAPVAEEADSPVSVAPDLAPPLAVDYASPAPTRPARPLYDLHLKLAGIMLAILCVPAYLIGAVLLISAAGTLIGSLWSGFSLGFPTSIALLASSGGPLIIGALLHASSAACFALRHIARHQPERDS